MGKAPVARIFTYAEPFAFHLPDGRSEPAKSLVHHVHEVREKFNAEVAIKLRRNHKESLSTTEVNRPYDLLDHMEVGARNIVVKKHSCPRRRT